MTVQLIRIKFDFKFIVEQERNVVTKNSYAVPAGKKADPLTDIGRKTMVIMICTHKPNAIPFRKDIEKKKRRFERTDYQ